MFQQRNRINMISKKIKRDIVLQNTNKSIDQYLFIQLVEGIQRIASLNFDELTNKYFALVMDIYYLIALFIICI